ncbi:hypothetical protein QAD02_014393 [Eretmocerus hayati]|uniref:Uncharacterized protein n=1 Tax=Eretmocerus hayati TaxID=131215 RepID=A0ACC2P575_9HYME|nr:hypothetical protein QAD02_014393 [Eretmocerus hayati]
MSASTSANTLGELKLWKYSPTFTWKINSFDNAHVRFLEPSKYIQSPKFSIGSRNPLNWCIQLYPNGFDSNTGDYMSLYLKFESHDQDDVEAKYHFSILIDSNVRIFGADSKNYRLFTPGSDWGFEKFISRDILFDERNKLLLNGSLAVCCKIDVNDRNSDIFDQQIPSSISLPSFQNQLLDDFESLLEDKKCYDVVLVVNERKFYAHRAILVARSSTFAKRFENTIRRESLSVEQIKNVKEEVMEEILRYIYTGEVKNIESVSGGLLAAAEDYALVDLKTFCEDVMSKNLEIDNVANTLGLAHSFKALSLKEKALSFISSNFETVLDTEGFKTLTIQHYDLVKEVLFVSILLFIVSLDDEFGMLPLYNSFHKK